MSGSRGGCPACEDMEQEIKTAMQEGYAVRFNAITGCNVKMGTEFPWKGSYTRLYGRLKYCPVCGASFTRNLRKWKKDVKND